MGFPFLAEASAGLGGMDFSTGGNWWQTVGGLAVVFGLLMLFLKLLKKMNRASGPGDTSIQAVWHLGPKREIQVLRLGEMVHYIYRHDGSMVILKEESLARFEAQHGKEARQPGSSLNLKDLFAGKVPFLRPRSSA